MTIRLKAFVRGSAGRTTHWIGTIVDETPVATKRLPVPEWLEIVQDEPGFTLLHFGSDGACFADTWHESLAQAMQQAKYEFDVSPDDWKPI